MGEQRSVEIPTRPGPKDEEQRADSDWGLAPAKPGLTRENKFILFVLLVLVAVFSFVVFRNYQKPKKDGKQAEEVTKAGESKGKNKKSIDKASQAEPPGQVSDGVEEGGEPPTLAESAPAQSGGDDPFGTGDAAGSGSETTDGVAAGGAGVSDTAGTGETGFDQDAAQAMLNGDQAPMQIGEASELAEQPAQGATESAPESAEAAAVASRHRSHRQNRSVPSQPASIETPVEMPAEIDPNITAASEFGETAATASEFTQTGGTTAAGAGVGTEPIGKRGGIDKRALAQADAQTNIDMSDMTTTSTGATAPRSSTAPRSATTPRAATRHRSAPNVPLDPTDQRLGGLRETDTVHPSERHSVQSGHQLSTRQPLVANQGEYIVKPHDNYWRISHKLYGTGRYFKALEKHNENNVANPKNMKPGLKISTPSEQQLQQAYKGLIPAAAVARPAAAASYASAGPKTPGYFIDADGQPAYRVSHNENLSSISHKTLGRSDRWDEIHELNQDRMTDADTLATGTVLRLPADASHTQVAGKPIQHQ